MLVRGEEGGAGEEGGEEEGEEEGEGEGGWEGGGAAVEEVADRAGARGAGVATLGGRREEGDYCWWRGQCG